MGNHHSNHPESTNHHSRNGIQRNNGNEIQQKFAKLSPIDNLTKLLHEKTAQEENVQGGITCNTFTRYVFGQYQDLGIRLFAYMAVEAGMSRNARVITTSNFRGQADKLLGVISDEKILIMYVTMFSEEDKTTQDDFRMLLMCVYRLAMDHYPDGPQSCRHILATVQAVVDAAFHKKSVLSISYLAHWIEQHCPLLIMILHRYVAHTLATAYRGFTEEAVKPNELELSTPVLEKSPFDLDSHPLLPLSQVWILSTTLPSTYKKPTHHHSPTGTSNGLTTQNFLAKVLDLTCPSHWTLLYNSFQHGLGSNRFTHHVLSYRGPTLMFLRGEQNVEFCVGTTQEWRESHQYWGGEDSIAIQILPLYHVIEKGPKIVYFNLSVRGYPYGIRAGSDPRNPSLQVDNTFTHITYCGIPYKLHSVEVWGCGSPENREVQLDIKKWQTKQAEKQRVVKLKASDWIDHPDRYLLELAGRVNYTDSTTNAQ